MKDNFKSRVESIVVLIPTGRVMTYGDIAGLAGQASAARVVGGIAHYGNPSLPWHRVVNRHGGLARGFPSGPDVQKQLLEQESVDCTDYTVSDFSGIRWSPHDQV